MALAATSAMELGIDVGDLDATVLTGYPGSVASTWQQAGRSGRRGDRALSVLVAQDNPLDQYLMRHPDSFFEQANESARISSENPYVLKPQLLCAAYEAPLIGDDAELFGPDLPALAAELESDGFLQMRRGRWHLPAHVEYPAGDVDIRSGSGGFFTLVDDQSGAVLETVDEATAYTQLYPGAVYLHQAEDYLVAELDLETRTAYAGPADVPYYTQARHLTETRVLNVYSSKPVGSSTVHLGEISVSTTVIAFRRRSRTTHESLGEQPVDLPTQSYDTVALWLDFPADTLAAIRSERRDLAGGLHAMEHAAIGLLPLFALCDRNDIGGLSTPLHPGHGPAPGLHPRRPPGGRRDRRARLRGDRGPVQGDHVRHHGVPVRVGLPGLRPLAQVRQQQPSSGQGRRGAASARHPVRPVPPTPGANDLRVATKSPTSVIPAKADLYTTVNRHSREGGNPSPTRCATVTPGATRRAGRPNQVGNPGSSLSLLAPRPCDMLAGVGVWRSLVAHLHGVQGVAGSNPVTPTIQGAAPARDLVPVPLPPFRNIELGLILLAYPR